MDTIMSLLLRREVFVLLLTILYLTAPLSWPVYSACCILFKMVASSLAHMLFRLNQSRVC
jgi:hypothetical protein